MFFTSNRYTSVRKKKSSLIRPRTLGIALLILSVLLMLYYSSDKGMESSNVISRVILYPIGAIQSVRNFVSSQISGLLENFRAKKELIALREEMETLKLENAKLKYKLKDHASYLDALRMPHEEDFPAVSAIVRYREKRLTQSLIINRGSVDGLSNNMPVWTTQGLIGRTIRMKEHASRVMPLTDPGSAVGCYVEGTSYEGVVCGTEEGKQLIFQDQHLIAGGDENNYPSPGNAVWTSGQGFVFPRDLLVGYISDATSEEGLVVEPAVDFESVKSVLIITTTSLEDEMLSLMTDG